MKQWLLPCLALATLGAGCRRHETASVAPALVPRFEDATSAAGVRFTHHTGAYGAYLIPESVGPGGAFLDYDGDGWQDVYLVNSTNWPGHGASGPTGALYHNRRDGTFEDVTRAAGLAAPMYGQGCAVGDYDNDGHDDLLVTCVGPSRLFHNQGNGRFREVTVAAGFDRSPWAWHTSAAWFDYDRDGKLDLFVGRYVKWTPATDVPCRTGSGKRTYCGPVQYVGDTSELYHNLGGGRFANVSVSSGISSRAGKALGVLPLDEDGDGYPDLLVTNDLVPNHLWHNDAGKRFREQGDMEGVAIGAIGRARAGMGVDVADTRNDGGLAFAIGNFSGEGLALFDRGGLVYTDRASAAGLVAPSLKSLTFGLTFLDADRDGWEDLFVYNGHVDPLAEESGDGTHFRQKPQLFQNRRGVFADVSAGAGPPFSVPQVGRGCAWGDFDNDGRPDLLLCENAGPTRLLHNATGDAHHWIGVRLHGSRSNRDGFGAEVRIRAGGMTQRRWVRSGSSFLSQSDSRALFGLGTQGTVETLEVRWPSGRVTTLPSPAIDRYLTVEEQ